MARSIEIKTKLNEGEYRVFKRYENHYGGTEAELIRKALRVFYINYKQRLETHEELIESAVPVRAGAKSSPNGCAEAS